MLFWLFSSPQVLRQQMYQLVKERLVDQKFLEEMIEVLFSSKPKMCTDKSKFEYYLMFLINFIELFFSVVA